MVKVKGEKGATGGAGKRGKNKPAAARKKTGAKVRQGADAVVVKDQRSKRGIDRAREVAIEIATVTGSALGGKLKRLRDDAVSYLIEEAKSGRSYCSKSGDLIHKGALRWTVRKGGKSFGFTLLTNVTPRMLINAINAHGSISDIYGFDSLSERQQKEALVVLRDIARRGFASKGGKKGRTGKGKKRSATAVNDDEDGGKDEDEILELQALSLDQVIAKKFAEADMITLDDSDGDDGGEDVPAGPRTPKPVVVVVEDTGDPTTARIRAPPDVKPRMPSSGVLPAVVNIDDHEEEEEEEEDEEEVGGEEIDHDWDDDDNADLPTRNPVSGDVIFVRWLEEPKKSYLCSVRKGRSGLTITSADGMFKGSLAFDPSLDQWRFAQGATKNPSTKATPIVAPDKRKLIKAATRDIKGMGTESVFKGLRFVVSGETDELSSDDHYATVRGIVEAGGGKVTSAISGVTNYLVAGTNYYNPFMGIRGSIERGTKYQKALKMPRCAIIDLPRLIEMAKEGVNNIKDEKQKQDQGGEKGTQECEV